MRKVILKLKENMKFEVIKKLVDNNGNKKRAAIEIGCTVRQINRLIIQYKLYGKEAFIHKNHSREPINKLSKEKVNEIITLFENKYFDANWTHALELLKRNHDINISYYCFFNILNKAGFTSPKCHATTRRKKAKQLRLALKEKQNKLTVKDKETISNCILDLEDAHPRLPRAKNAGEIMELDASEYIWFGNKKTTIHGAIDDATGTIDLFFDEQETLKGYYGLLKSILINYGIPYSFLTDNRTVFYYNSKKDEELVKDTYTQFGYACKQLGITINTTSIPQKKGRIERLWNTLQSRLPVEMRLAGIDSIEKANVFLKNFTRDFNKQFAIPINNTKNVFEKQPSIEKINYTLAVISPRMFDNGCSIRYQNKYWQAFENDRIVAFKNKTKALVIKALDESMLVSVDESIYELRELIKNKEVSEDFPTVNDIIIKPKKTYIPPMTHPWKRDSYISYVNSQPHHKNNAYV